MRLLAIVGLSLAAISHSSAATCDLSAAAKETFSAQRQREAQVHLQLVETGKQIEALTGSTDWSKMDAIRESLSADDQPRLDALLNRRKEFTLERVHETNRLRDILLISRLATIAHQHSEGAAHVPDDKESIDYKLTGVLLAARDVLPVEFEEAASYKPGTDCTFETALQQAALAAANQFRAQAAHLTEIRTLAAKYGQPLDPKKMSAEDAASYEKLAPLARKALAVSTLSLDLARLAKIEAASKLMFEALGVDQSEAPGKVEHVGSTWTRWSDDGRLSKEQKEAANLVMYFYRKFPAEAVFASTESATEH